MDIELGLVSTFMVHNLEKLKLSLTHYYCLLALKLGILDVPTSCILTLERKGYIFQNKLTAEGEKLLEIIKTDTNVKTELKKVKDKYNDQFIEWWNTYPPGDAWVYGAKTWEGTRSFRTKKENCESLYLSYLKEGVKHEDLIRALKYEVAKKKAESIRSSTNKMTYITNTHSYLLNRLYEGFIEMANLENWTEDSKKPVDKFKIKSII